MGAALAACWVKSPHNPTRKGFQLQSPLTNPLCSNGVGRKTEDLGVHPPSDPTVATDHRLHGQSLPARPAPGWAECRAPLGSELLV